jgi:uncharacterized membrane protein
VTARLRLSALWQHLKGSLWVLPSLFVVSALALGTALSQLETVEGTFLEGVVFGGTASGARDVLAIIAGSMITVIGLSFSLTVVALQMASAQFSPRVLRAFLEDRGNQIVISVLLATFAYSLAVIRVIRDEDSPQGEFLPRIAVTVGIVFTLLAVMALVYFIHNLTQELRGDTIMTGIVAAALATIERMHPDPAGGARDERELPCPPARSTGSRPRAPATCRRSGSTGSRGPRTSWTRSSGCVPPSARRSRRARRSRGCGRATAAPRSATCWSGGGERCTPTCTSAGNGRCSRTSRSDSASSWTSPSRPCRPA